MLRCSQSTGDEWNVQAGEGGAGPEWTRTTIDSIAWRNIKSARNKCNATQTTQTSKIMHAWLPVMHMLGHISGSSQCPSCTHPDETLDHLFHCPHPLLRRKREQILEHLRKKGLKLKIPYPVISAWCSLLSSYFDGIPPDIQFHSPELQLAASSQISIGLRFLPRGFMSREWLMAMEAHGCESPDRKLASMILFLWFDVTDALWRVRNDIVHHSQNLNELAQEGMLDDQLKWYLSHYRTVLSRHDYKTATRYTVDDLDAIPLRTKRQWIHHLEVARTAFDQEKITLAPGQQLLTNYFSFRGQTPQPSLC